MNPADPPAVPRDMLTYYKHVLIINYAGPPTSEEITAIETALGATLPPDFRAFLEVANGGGVPFLVNVPAPDGEELAFSPIFSTKPDARGDYGYGTFLGEIREIPKSLGIPQRVLPFASDGGGSTIYLDLTEAGKGRVVAFVHGLPAWTGRPSHDAFVEVAASFSEYVDLLYYDEDDDWTE